jgi:glycosyltransferase involved in cell wall biosynthesis
MARVEFSPLSDGRDTLVKRRRALFFFAGCFMGRTDGCHVRAMQTLDLMISAGLDVVIYSYRQHPSWHWTPQDEAACEARFPRAQLALEEWRPSMQLVAKAKTALSLLGPGARNLALKLNVPGMTPVLDSLKREAGFDVVIISYAAGLTIFNGLPDSTIIVDQHDFAALERVSADGPGMFDFGAKLGLRKELGLLSAADVVWCISFSEARYLQKSLGPARIRFVPPTVDPGLGRLNGAPEFDLLFVGSDNRWNANALLRFFDDFASWKSSLSLAVAGNVSLNPNVRARAAGMAGVKLLGFQSDLAALYRRARAAICPVEGTGTKIKVVEALAAERPVFAAPGALTGLAPGYDGCVFPLEEGAIVAILGDREAMQAAKAAARTYAGHFTLDAVLQSIKADLE